jgi:hypothetical protein
MYNQNDNTGIILAFKGAEGCCEGGEVRKGLKSLLIWVRAPNFKQYCHIVIRKVSYFCTPKKITVENNPNISGKLQMTDILVANAVLSAFTIEMDDNTTKFLKETEQKQDEVLKLKEVNEERLRMVVQL